MKKVNNINLGERIQNQCGMIRILNGEIGKGVGKVNEPAIYTH